MTVHRKGRPVSVKPSDLEEMDKLLLSFDELFRAAQTRIRVAGHTVTLEREGEHAEGADRAWAGTNKYHALSHVTSDIREYGAPSEFLTVASARLFLIQRHVCQSTTTPTSTRQSTRRPRHCTGEPVRRRTKASTRQRW